MSRCPPIITILIIIIISIIIIIIIIIMLTYHHHHSCRCWTQGKQQKLDYLRKAHMWYLTDQCSTLETLLSDSRPISPMDRLRGRPVPGAVYTVIENYAKNAWHTREQLWNRLSNQCCQAVARSP